MATDKTQMLHNCPSCDGNIPVVSKICEFCGYQFLEMVEDAHTPESLQSMIAASLEKMRSVSKTGLFRILFRNYFITLPAAALLSLLAVFANPHDPAGYTFCTLSGLAVISILIKVIRVRKKSDKKPSLNLYRAEVEQYSRIARAYFGGNREVRRAVGAFRLELQGILDKKGRAETRTFIILSILVLGFVTVTAAYIEKNAFVPFEVYKEQVVSRSDAIRWTVAAEGIEGPLAEYYQLVPSKVPAWIDIPTLDSYNYGSKLIVDGVKFLVPQAASKELPPGKTMDLKAVLSDDRGLEIGVIRSRAFDLPTSLRYDSDEVFITFDELDTQYYVASIAEDLQKATRMKIVSSWVEKKDEAHAGAE